MTMTKISELATFDITEMLQTDQDIAEYLTVVIEDGDPAMLAYLADAPCVAPDFYGKLAYSPR